jgi:hypothetical protein
MQGKRWAMGIVGFSFTAMIACIDSAMDGYTREETAILFCNDWLRAVEVLACVAFVLVGCRCASKNATVESAKVDSRLPCSIGEKELRTPVELARQETPCEAELNELFEEFDNALSAELQDQFRNMMGALEVEQRRELEVAMVDSRDVHQAAVSAFSAALATDEEPTPNSMVEEAVSIDRALDRLEEEVRRRSGGRRLGWWSKGSPTARLLMVSFLVIALGGVCADRLEKEHICSSTVMEAGIIFVFMPLGFLLFPRLGLRRSVSTR